MGDSCCDGCHSNAGHAHHAHHADHAAVVGASAPLRVALAGNPNVGKSSLFNQLTGGHQHVGNWPGKTVERRTGTCGRGTTPIEFIDLPGTYSLASSSPEELVAEAVLVGPDVDVIVVVLDSTNLERNLYLAAQAAELGRPLALVLNMVDVAESIGVAIDDAALGAAFAAPVVRTVGRTGFGVDELVTCLTELAAREPAPAASVAEAITAANDRVTTRS